jgi:cell division transport system permease protein
MARLRRRPAPPVRLPRRLESWLDAHAGAAWEALARLLRAPLATLMTLAAIAVALALPATLFVSLENLERLGGDWQLGKGLSLFLTPDLDEQRAGAVAVRIAARPDVADVELISREEGLAEFREYSGLGAALDQLDENPLPVVLAVEPAPSVRSPAALDALAAALQALPEAEFARLDIQWARRFNAILALLTRAAWLLSAVLGLGVLLIVGNTIRLEIENRRGEVQIMDLVGATQAFIRRPFLYSGAWQGLLGGMAAWALVAITEALLRQPVSSLATLYRSEFALAGLSPVQSLGLLAIGILLGVAGSWIAVDRQLRHVRPT